MINLDEKNESPVLRGLFDSAIAAVAGENSTRRALQNFSAETVYVIAIGKAAASMMHGAIDALGTQLSRALVISKYEHIDDTLKNDDRCKCMESAHPVPDGRSLEAGLHLQQFLQGLPNDSNLLVLISGGASSLVESLHPDLSLKDLQRVNHYLLSAGLDINVMNTVRKSLSLIKGGRLANFLGPQATLQLLISDVPGDALDSIGSGLLVQPATGDHAFEFADTLPDWIKDYLRGGSSTPDSDSPIWSQIESKIIASNKMACHAAADCARSNGLVVQQDDGILTGDVTNMASMIAQTLTDPNQVSGIYIWGGETTVLLPESPGRGGRNQQLALRLLIEMQMSSSGAETVTTRWQALCCGTDGSDGPTSDAGGLVDNDTFNIGVQRGLDIEQYLVSANSGEYLQRTDALVTTGPTGTNVMDLVIALKA
ncbi:MAG: glycerate kinase [Granulosicoccus sp.]